ncbi:MAG: MmgE/PrpD family protein [Firmicutes bacterium]|jgi:2-methylcitrate dehydratase PrpD|nr:MmgE/PrpD family protein [Bacillota bacterium]
MAALEYELATQLLTQLEHVPPYPLRARKVFADTIVVMIKGAREPEIQQLAATLAMPQGVATMLAGEDLKATPERAALVNASGATFLELDEGIRPTGHPGVHLVPSLLAEVQARCSGVTMGTVLKSLVVGYEVTARLATSLQFHRAVHPHGHIGSVGIAAAIGHMRGWDAQRVGQSMAIAAALPLRTDWRPCFTGHTVRNAYAGLGAAIGFFAVDLAEAGFNGEWGTIEHILAPALGDGIQMDALLTPSTRWAIDKGYHKFYAGCALTHPSTEAALKLWAMGPWPVDLIQSVEVEVPERYMRTAVLPNGTRLSAKFSIPWAVAGALLTGVSDDSLYQEPLLSDPRIQRLASRVHTKPAGDLTERFPDLAGSRVHLVLNSHQRISAFCEDPRGGLQYGASWDALRQKADDLLPGLEDAWWDALTAFPDEMPAVDWWARILQSLPRGGDVRA